MTIEYFLNISIKLKKLLKPSYFSNKTSTYRHVYVKWFSITKMQIISKINIFEFQEGESECCFQNI